MGSATIIIEFEHESHYYVYFKTILMKGMNILIFPFIGEVVLQLFFYKWGIAIKFL